MCGCADLLPYGFVDSLIMIAYLRRQCLYDCANRMRLTTRSAPSTQKKEKPQSPKTYFIFLFFLSISVVHCPIRRLEFFFCIFGKSTYIEEFHSFFWIFWANFLLGKAVCFCHYNYSIFLKLPSTEVSYCLIMLTFSNKTIF